MKPKWTEAVLNKFVSEWPNCAVPGCKFKSCFKLKSPLCYPHTMQKRQRAGEEMAMAV